MKTRELVVFSLSTGTTVDMTVMIAEMVLQYTSFCLPLEVVNYINEFLVWDRTTIRFINYLHTKCTNRKKMLGLILHSMNRKNGFHGKTCQDTEDPHWVWETSSDGKHSFGVKTIISIGLSL